MIRILNFFIICTLLCLSLSISAQFSEHFDGATFNASGLWSGDTSHFNIDANQAAVLNAASAGTTRFATSDVWQDSMEFSFDFNLNFAPSTQNYLEIHLTNSSIALDGSSALLFKIGETGSDDGLQLMEIEGGNQVLLQKSGVGLFGNKPSGKLNVLYLNDSLIVDFLDNSGIEHSIMHYHYASLKDKGSSIGFKLVYTSSNTKNYQFDNIVFSRWVPDVMKPRISSFDIQTPNEINLNFSEAIRPLSIDDTSLFKLKLASDQQLLADLTVSANKVSIVTVNDLVNGANYQLSVHGISDLAGNQMNDTTLEFKIAINEINFQDILINEIMADPTPVIGLPDAEYIELYNNSTKDLNLNNLKLYKESSGISLPNYPLNAGEYVILTATNSLGLWSGYNHVLGVPSFPAINNTGTTFSLVNNNSEKIHEVSFNTASYGNAAKADGGWSLELDHTALCSPQALYASNDANGGTPGKINSIRTDEFRLSISAFETTDTSILICLNTAIDWSMGTSFRFEPALPFRMKHNSIAACNEFIINTNLEKNRTYNFFVSNPFDCNGVIQQFDTSLVFGVFDPPNDGDLLINEILFDPLTGGADYVEIYNRSARNIDLGKLIIANEQKGEQKSPGVTFVIGSAELAVFTVDKNYVLQNYPVADPTHLLIASSMPAFNQDKGNVTLYYKDGSDLIFLDSMSYDSKMHNPFLESTKGISLERVSTDITASERSNWSSASSIEKGSPTGPNTQSRKLSGQNETLYADQDHLSPNGDGFLDELIIGYHLDKGGYALRWKIFDVKGRLVNSGNPGILTGSEGFFTWAGDDSYGKKVLPGIYIILGDFIHLDGSQKKGRITTVVSLPN